MVAPDDPFAKGMVDAMQKWYKGWANCRQPVESSKGFQNLMKKYGIPTADYALFSDWEEALEYLNNQNILCGKS